MASRRAQARIGRLWQMPALLAAVGLFGYAAYLFIGPRPALTTLQRIQLTEALLKNEHFDKALEEGNKLLLTGHLKEDEQARVHLLLAGVLEAAQKQKHISLASNHRSIIEQTREALAHGVKESADLYRRVAESEMALDRPVTALADYRKAIALDSDHSTALQRRLIDLELKQADLAPAEASIEKYLAAPRLDCADRAWALVQKAQALAKRNQFAQARPELDDALLLDREPFAQGVANYWLGYCTWKVGEKAEAERVLRVSRDQLTISHPLDADAAFALGKLRQEQNDPLEAVSFYEQILTSHPESSAAMLARLNRGICRIMQDEADAGLSDLHDVIGELAKKKDRNLYQPDVLAGLKSASALLSTKGNTLGALEALEDEQTVMPEPPAEFFGRLAAVFENRANDVEQTIAAATTPGEKLKREDQVRRLRIQAADAYIALSRGLTLADDRGQGEAMWKGVNLYDRAGAMQRSIAAMETFVAERPSDSETPDALLRLGKAFQATGQFGKAIKALLKIQFRYPQSLAANKSGVPLAQAYMAEGPAAYPKAEKALLGVLENNLVITPEAEEFRLALSELAQLYYRTGRYEEAIARLEETTQRYPNDQRMSQLLFLMADSYRKSAGLLAAKIAATKVPANADSSELAAATATRAEATSAWRDRLTRARDLFGRVVDMAHGAPPTRDLDKLYLKLSHFYRADCFYDLGDYAEAIRLYDTASLRYQDDPSSVSALIQIVNSYCAMGRLDEARTANTRAKWLLRQMPAVAFEEGKSSVPKKYWDDWLRLTGESGIYARDLKPEPVTDAR